MRQTDKITDLVDRNSGDSMFDIETAIEMCRQSDDTLPQAEALAEKSKNYKLLVQIKVENSRDNLRALNILDENVNNMKDKVDLLK